MKTTEPQPKVNILLVDDQPANLLALEAVLDDLGQNLVRASSGEEALKQLRADEFAVVLLDVQMEGLDGFETAKRMGGCEKSRDTPIIFLTAYDSPAFPAATAYTVGAVDYLVKPLVPEILRAKVAVFVELFQKTQQVKCQGERLRQMEQRELRGHLATQYACARVMAEAETVAEALPRVLEAICQGLRWDWSSVWTLDAGNQVLRCVDTWHDPALDFPRFEEVSRHRRMARGEGLPGRVWASGKPAWINNVQQDPNFPRLAVAQVEGLRGALGFPIFLEGEFLAVVEFLSREVREADEDVLQMLTALGSQLGQFISRKRAEEELRRQREWLAVTLLSIGDAVIATDTTGQVIFMNPMAEALTGWTQAEVVGKPLEEIFHIVNEETRAPVDNPVTRVLHERTLKGLANHTLLIARNGVERPIADCASPIHDGNKLHGVVLIFHDVTEQRALERELHKRAEQLLEADRRKDEFLAMLAHELRNPLAPIRNALHVLHHKGGDWKTVEQVREMMTRQVAHLARLVDDLLDVSRITRGKIVLRKERLDLARLVHQCVHDHQNSFETAGVTLQVEAPDTPVWVTGDATRLTQVLDNLLGNALKFTNRGGEVAVRLAPGAARRHVLLTVSDTGIGIETEMLPRVFEVFSQADRTLARSPGGLGLGLALVKGLVELHDGRVQAASPGVSQGAAFTIQLPLEEELPALSQVPVSSQPTRKHRHILVVEDNQDSAESLRMLLELVGYEVTLAATGPEGVAAASKVRPDVVLCDIGLPGMDGFAVAQALRNNPHMADTRLIAITGYGQEEDRQRAFQAGFDEHLVKPVDPDKLLGQLALSPLGKQRGDTDSGFGV